MKYNIRRMSDIERESFSTRRTSHVLGIDPPVDGRRPTIDDLYESILPQYVDALNNDAVDSDSSSQETRRYGSVTWQLDRDHDTDQANEDTDRVLRKLITGESFNNTPTSESDPFSPKRKQSSVKDRVRRSLHQVQVLNLPSFKAIRNYVISSTPYAFASYARAKSSSLVLQRKYLKV